MLCPSRLLKASYQYVVWLSPCSVIRSSSLHVVRVCVCVCVCVLQPQDSGTLNQQLSNLGPEKERLALEALLDIAEICVQRASTQQGGGEPQAAGGAGGVVPVAAPIETLLGVHIRVLASEDGFVDAPTIETLGPLLDRPLRQLLPLAQFIAERTLGNTQMLSRFPQHMRVC